jgi:hypothetical protein
MMTCFPFKAYHLLAAKQNELHGVQVASVSTVNVQRMSSVAAEIAKA